MDFMYGVTTSLNLGSTCCNLHCKNIGCNLQQFFLMFFSQGTRPKPKHKALILFGLFLMWTFHFNFEFFIFTFVVTICFLHWFFLFIGFLKGALKEGVWEWQIMQLTIKKKLGRINTRYNFCLVFILKF
jgi:hypothetical protein